MVREFKEIGRKRAKCEFVTDELKSAKRWMDYLSKEKIEYTLVCIVGKKNRYTFRIYGGQLITEKLIGFYVNEYWSYYRKELMET